MPEKGKIKRINKIVNYRVLIKCPYCYEVNGFDMQHEPYGTNWKCPCCDREFIIENQDEAK